MSEANVLVIGSNGQVGQHLAKRFPHWTYWGRSELDLTDLASIPDAIEHLRPKTVVNVAAFTEVDRAEVDRALAWRINCEAPAQLAKACRALDVHLLHVSTDYVFDGSNTSPYLPGDTANPLSTYGATKCAGELAVRTLAEKYWILRTCWVFSEFNKNFVKTMLRIAQDRDELSIVNDQLGAPTHAAGIAEAIGSLVNDVSPQYGTRHYCGSEAMSWFDFAERIFSQAAAANLITTVPKLIPIPTEKFPTPAERPKYSVLASDPLFDHLEYRKMSLDEQLMQVFSATATPAR